jgi:hypothetical protein
MQLNSSLTWAEEKMGECVCGEDEAEKILIHIDPISPPNIHTSIHPYIHLHIHISIHISTSPSQKDTERAERTCESSTKKS